MRRLRMMFDPQTSGGLLIAVAPGRARALRDDLRECGYHAAEIVGELGACGCGRGRTGAIALMPDATVLTAKG